MKTIFTEKDIQFLIENYSNNGAEYCATQLNKPIKQIKCKIAKIRKKFGIQLNKKMRSYCIKKWWDKNPKLEGFQVDPNQFINIVTKEVVYLLGLIWADGYVCQKNNVNKIDVSMKSSDIDSLLPIFKKTGKWLIYNRNRKNRLPQTSVITNNKIIVDFLIENDYRIKSNESADKIISKIPNNLLHYWFRGLIDGDGSVYVNRKNGCYQLSVNSSKNQNWFYLEKILKTLNIKHSIIRSKPKYKSQFSTVRITSIKNILKFANFIYPTLVYDNVGLKRKFDKFLEINDVHRQNELE